MDVCRRGLERHPAYLSARVTLGRALIELDQLEAGARELQHVLASAPENLAEVHRRRGELPESIELADDPAPVPAPAVVQPPERIPVPVEVAQTAGAESDAIVGRLETFLNAVN